jgi:hypothetical protein
MTLIAVDRKIKNGLGINSEAKMLDQYQGTLLCVVNYNDGSFAECDILDAISIKPEVSIDDEFWLGASGVQVHADLLNLDEEQFRAQYPVGRKFRMELTVRVIEEEPITAGSAQVGPRELKSPLDG